MLAHSNNPEDPIPLLASIALALIMANSGDDSAPTEHALSVTLSYLSSQIKQSNDAGLQDTAIIQYASMLTGRPARQVFWKQRSETITPLVDILRKAAGVGDDSSATLWNGNSSLRSTGSEGISGGVGLQLLYHVLLVLWQLSFGAEDVGDELDE